VYRNEPQIPPGEEWYYELDGRAHGPMSRSDLEELLNRAGETAAEVRVRRGAEGLWAPFRSPSLAAGASPTAASIAESRSSAADSRCPLGPQRSGSPLAADGFPGWVRAYWDVGVAMGLWILLNVSFFLFWPESHSRERRYLQALKAITVELQDLRGKPTSEAEWHQFAERTRASLNPIVSDLKKSANSSEPVKQQLLWSARDVIPHTLGPRTRERDEQEQRLKKYLDSAERQLDSR
jgi:hypothetical protein